MIFTRAKAGKTERLGREAPVGLVASRDFEQRADLEERIASMATASISLSKLAPKLASLANEMAEGAELQAKESTQIAKQATEMSTELERAIESLKASSESVGGIVQSIKRLADQSKILAINASIEAANAGRIGRAFGAVAVEVENLASRTSTATSDVSEKVAAIESSIQQAVTAAGLENSLSRSDRSSESSSIRGIGYKVDSIAAVARQNSSSALAVAETGREVRALCDSLLLTVGKFRIRAHDRAARIFSEICSHASLRSSSRLNVERFLEQKVRQFPIFEIFYLTDASGVQRTENVWFDGGIGRGSALGRDWSGRSWFLEALAANGQTRISDIYLSVATDSYCFTLSRAIRDDSGALVAVLAADVNFANLLEIV